MSLHTALANVFPTQTLNLSGAESEEECERDNQLAIDMLDERRNDVLGLSSRVMRRLTRSLRLAENFDIVPGLRFDISQIDRMTENATGKRTDTVSRERLMKALEEMNTSGFSDDVQERNRIDVVFETLRQSVRQPSGMLNAVRPTRSKG